MAAKQKSEETGSPSAPGRSEESGPTSPLGEIEQGPSAAERFLEANGKKLLLLVGLAVIGTGALIVASGLKEVQEEKAGEALVSAKDPGDFRNIIDGFPGTAAEGTARLRLALLLWDEGERDSAKKVLEDFIAQTPDHPAQPPARMTLSSFLRDEGNEDGADEMLSLIHI